MCSVWHSRRECETGEAPAKRLACTPSFMCLVIKHTGRESFRQDRPESGSDQSADKEIHIIVDNLSAHKTKRVVAFLAEHPNVSVHYTPTYSSWLNQVEIWFSKVQRDLIARGIFE